GVRRSVGTQLGGRLARNGGDPDPQEREGRMAASQGRRRRPAREAGPPQIELRVAARNAAHAARVIREAAREFALPDEWLSMSLVGDKEISRLNLDWRGKGSPTDVLSWSPGEIVISLDTVRQQPPQLERQRPAALAGLPARGVE